jgi:integrase
MASIFKPSYTKRGPDGEKVSRHSRCWWIEFRDGDGTVRRVKGFPDRKATLAKAAELEKTAARGVVAGVDPFAAHDELPLARHLDDYDAYLAGQDAGAKWRKESRARIEKIVSELGATRLRDFDGARVAAFLEKKVQSGASARTRNVYRTSMSAFLTWARADGRLPKELDPLALVGTLNEQKNPRRKRRALTPDEVARLIAAARRRPLDAAEKERCNAGVSDDERARLTQLGTQRALTYMALYYSGLRVGELAKLRVGDLVLPEDPAMAGTATFFAKAQETQTVSIRPDLVAELRAWIAANGLVPTDLVFDIPGQLVKVMKKDLAHAGIPYKDELGRVADVHALRKTMATALSVAKVSPRVAQKVLRHSKLELTMGIYTDDAQLDAAAAVGALPALPPILVTPRIVAKAADDGACRPACRTGTHSNGADCTCVHSPPVEVATKEQAQAVWWPGLEFMGDTGLEPVTSCVSSRRSSQLS